MELFLFAKKNEFLDLGRDSLYFQVFPGHFYFMRGHSLVELMEHDKKSMLLVLVFRTLDYSSSYTQVETLPALIDDVHTAGTFNMPTSYN